MTESKGTIRFRDASRHPLRVTLTVWTVLISLVIQLTLGLVVLLYQRSSIDETFDSRLKGRAAIIADALREPGFSASDESLAGLAARNEGLEPLDRVVVGVYSPGGEVAASSVRPAFTASELGLARAHDGAPERSEEHTSELQSRGLISYA